VRRFTPDVLVLDYQMKVMSGLACLEQLRKDALPVRVLVLSTFGDAHAMRAVPDAGADGFALKTDSPLATVAAIRQVAARQLVFPQSARRWLSPTRSAPDALTEREEKVLALVAEGASNAQIATSLSVSESTIKFHLRNLFAKVGVANRTEAAAHYHRRG
jgi:DNA-binding NarL/FixJ family response regulator